MFCIHAYVQIIICWEEQVKNSVTRLGDLLHFGQLFKVCGNKYFAQIAYIFIQFL